MGYLNVNDYASIQLAIDAAQVAGNGLYFPPGVYTVSSTLVIDGTKPLTICGAGAAMTDYDQTIGVDESRLGTVIQAGSDNLDVFSCVSFGICKFTFRDFAIHAGGHTGVVGFKSQQITNTVFDNISFIGGLVFGIKFRWSIYNTYKNCFFGSCDIGLSLWNYERDGDFVYNLDEFHMNTEISDCIFNDNRIGLRVSSFSGVINNLTLGRNTEKGLQISGPNHNTNNNSIVIDHIYSEDDEIINAIPVDIYGSTRLQIDDFLYNNGECENAIVINSSTATVSVGVFNAISNPANPINAVHNLGGNATIAAVFGSCNPFSSTSTIGKNFLKSYEEGSSFIPAFTLYSPGNGASTITIPKAGGVGYVNELSLYFSEGGRGHKYLQFYTIIGTKVIPGHDRMSYSDNLRVKSIYNSATGYYDIIIDNVSRFLNNILFPDGAIISKPKTKAFK